MCEIVFIIILIVVVVSAAGGAAATYRHWPTTHPRSAPCPDCGQPLKAFAESCPHCGSVFRKSA